MLGWNGYRSNPDCWLEKHFWFTVLVVNIVQILELFRQNFRYYNFLDLKMAGSCKWIDNSSLRNKTQVGINIVFAFYMPLCKMCNLIQQQTPRNIDLLTPCSNKYLFTINNALQSLVWIQFFKTAQKSNLSHTKSSSFVWCSNEKLAFVMKHCKDHTNIARSSQNLHSVGWLISVYSKHQ